MKNRFFIAVIACNILLTLSSPALATEPAVSAINGQAGITAGSVDSDTLIAVDGSVTFPLNKASGLQLDAGFGEWDSDTLGDTDITRLGLHLFACPQSATRARRHLRLAE